MNILSAVDAADLIAELKRRKRIHVVAVTTGFFNEQAEDAKYVRTMESELVSRVGAGLHNALCMTFEDQVLARDAEDRPIRSTRTASLMVLVPEGVDCEAD